MEHVPVEHSRQRGDGGHWPFGIPITLSIPGSNARIEHCVVEREKQLDLIVELVLIALGVKLGRLHS